MFKKNKKIRKLSPTELEIMLLTTIEAANPSYSDETTLFREILVKAPLESEEVQPLFDKCKKRGYISQSIYIRLTKEGAYRLDNLKDNLKVKEESHINRKILWITLAVSAASALFALIQILLSVIGLFA